ncbi:MAG: Fpg/Nei family DNA glycosylase [Candidatus Coatesbacteria bacterium]|nr:MAG: Fpg/Nei family DNA glycosylase [Candidatus Coatesbacteria bacterium]
MPELPEIFVIANQMNNVLTGKTVARVEIRQPKNLNVPADEFEGAVVGKTFGGVEPRGKWIFAELKPGYLLLINLGMGGDLIYFKDEADLPENYHFKLDFDDGTGFTARFFWFGYIHLVGCACPGDHKMTADLGPSPVADDFTVERFLELLEKKKRSGVKSLLTNQKNITGIGNVYAQDVLFVPKLHPLRKVASLSDDEKRALYDAIQTVLNESIDLGGLKYEKDFFGASGRYSGEHMLVAYKEGKPCPECGTTIEKIKTGSTASYICPKCQKE